MFSLCGRGRNYKAPKASFVGGSKCSIKLCVWFCVLSKSQNKHTTLTNVRAILISNYRRNLQFFTGYGFDYVI